MFSIATSSGKLIIPVKIIYIGAYRRCSASLINSEERHQVIGRDISRSSAVSGAIDSRRDVGPSGVHGKMQFPPVSCRDCNSGVPKRFSPGLRCLQLPICVRTAVIVKEGNYIRPVRARRTGEIGTKSAFDNQIVGSGWKSAYP